MAMALSIKGGAMLWLPGILLVTAFISGIFAALFLILFVMAFNLLIAVPFIQANPKAFFAQAFDFGRKFWQHLSYNSRWVSNMTYSHPAFVIAGYVITLLVLLSFLMFRWTSIRSFFKDIRLYPLTCEHKVVDPRTAAVIMFTSALIAIVCAPGLHP